MRTSRVNLRRAILSTLPPANGKPASGDTSETNTNGTDTSGIDPTTGLAIAKNSARRTPSIRSVPTRSNSSS